MKNKTKLQDSIRNILKGLITAFILYISISASNAQKPLEISTGIGLPETLFLGVRYRADQTKFGFTIGGVPSSSILTLGFDIYRHFGRNAEQMDGSTWFINLGVNSLKENTEYAIEKWIYLKGRVGREFFISSAVSIDLSLGPIYELKYSYREKEPQPSCWFCGGFAIPKLLPSIAVRVNAKI